MGSVSRFTYCWLGDKLPGQLANLLNLHLQNSKKTSHPKLSSEPCETFHYPGNLQNPRKVPRPSLWTPFLHHLRFAPGPPPKPMRVFRYMPMLGGNFWKWQNISKKSASNAWEISNEIQLDEKLAAFELWSWPPWPVLPTPGTPTSGR